MILPSKYIQISTLMILSVVPFLMIRTAQAQQTAGVTATVTVQNIAISVSDGSVAYGILALNSSAGTNAIDTQTALNDGNVTIDINITGQNTAAWTLAATNGADQYIHRFCIASCATAPTNYTPLTTSYQTLTTGVAPAANQTFDLYITTPTTTTSYIQQNADVTVQAVLP